MVLTERFRVTHGKEKAVHAIKPKCSSTDYVMLAHLCSAVKQQHLQMHTLYKSMHHFF